MPAGTLVHASLQRGATAACRPLGQAAQGLRCETWRKRQPPVEKVLTRSVRGVGVQVQVQVLVLVLVLVQRARHEPSMYTASIMQEYQIKLDRIHT